MTMSRVSYCSKCHREGRPKTGDMFVVYGTDSQALLVYEALHNGRRGFTPHLFELKRVVEDKIYFSQCCGMVGCGTEVEIESKRTKTCQIRLIEVDNRKTTLKNWNALVLFKRDPLFEI